MSWVDDFRYNAIRPLLASKHTAITYWVEKELLNKKVPSVKAALWGQKIPQSILRKQNADGSWTYPTRRASKDVNYDQVETYRQLGFLVEMFGYNREHPSIEKAAEYIFSHQSVEGDIRGIYANQYSPNYTAALLELLVKAGYGKDNRAEKVFSWLDSVRQYDRGWALAFRTRGYNLDAIYANHEKLTLDKTRPFSHLVTGIVLRAYAAHPEYCYSDTATTAARLLISRLFDRDVYPDRNRKNDWTRFSFPFWETDLLTVLDVVGLIKPSLVNDKKIQQAKCWFIEHQQADGLFAGHLLKDRYHDLRLWYSYAICRTFSRFSSE